MSEYQYYEFVAVDRPLSAEQQRELRQITSRASITAHRMVNEYQWGDFKGDPLAMLEQYFDAHLYYANWGTRVLMFAFPSHLVDIDSLNAYHDDEFCRIIERGDRVIVELSEPEGEGEWDYQGEPELAALMPIRDQILAGDLRSLYLAALKGLGIWLDELELDDEEDEEINLEPPLPAGLRQLNASLDALIDLLEINRDLVEVAAEASPALPSTEISEAALESWIRSLSESEKDALLVRVVRGEPGIANELIRRFRANAQPDYSRLFPPPRRQTAELIGKAEKRREARLQEEAARRDAEAARAHEELAQQRAAHLDRLRGQEPRLWQQVDELASTKKPNDYDRAVTLLSDLRELARESGGLDQFRDHLFAFRNAHARKPSLLQRLDKAGLR